MSLGPAEILVIFVVALLVFGPTRLPEVGRQVGRGMKEIRKFQQTLKGDLNDAFNDDSSAGTATTPASAPTEPAPTLPPKELGAPGAAPGAAAEGAGASEPPPTTPPA